MKNALAIGVLLLGVFAIGFASNEHSTTTFLGPRVVAKVSLLNQTAQIPPTTLFRPPTDGMFRVSVYETMVVPGDGYSVELAWTDNAGAENENVGGTAPGYGPPTAYCLAPGSQDIPCGTTLVAKAGTPIICSTSGDSNGGTYDLYIVVERLD